MGATPLAVNAAWEEARLPNRKKVVVGSDVAESRKHSLVFLRDARGEAITVEVEE